jgi:hypothetical protein
MSSSVRTRPLVVVVSCIPLFTEALAAALAGIADVVAVSAEDESPQELVRAYGPDAAVVEGSAPELIDDAIVCIHVDIEASVVNLRRNGSWSRYDVDLSAEAIRNVIVAAIYGGDVA